MLYHYTDFNAFDGIIRCAELRLNNILNMNDAAEDDEIRVDWEVEDMTASVINSRKVNIKAAGKRNAALHPLQRDMLLIPPVNAEQLHLPVNPQLSVQRAALNPIMTGKTGCCRWKPCWSWKFVSMKRNAFFRIHRRHLHPQDRRNLLLLQHQTIKDDYCLDFQLSAAQKHCAQLFQETS